MTCGDPGLCPVRGPQRPPLGCPSIMERISANPGLEQSGIQNACPHTNGLGVGDQDHGRLKTWLH